MFTITGPDSPSVLSNMPVSIEQHVEWIMGCIEHMRKHGLATMEAKADAEMRWTAHVADLANASLLPTADSWYIGANIPGKPRVFMPHLAVSGLTGKSATRSRRRGMRGLLSQRSVALRGSSGMSRPATRRSPWPVTG
jgi:cyclohexanone monooxygenase